MQHLYSGIDPLIEVNKKGQLKETDLAVSWKTSQKLMANPQQFMDKLLDFSKLIDNQEVNGQNFKAIKYLIDKPEFNKEELNVKSTAAGGVCDWIRNIYQYFDVVTNVEPMRLAVKEAQVKLEAATIKKNEMEALVAELNEKLSVLMGQYQAAMDTKKAAEDKAAYCAERLNRANRLVGALGAEKDRWSNSIITLGEEL